MLIHMDYFYNVFMNFLKHKVNERTETSKNIFICVSEMNESLMFLE